MKKILNLLIVLVSFSINAQVENVKSKPAVEGQDVLRKRYAKAKKPQASQLVDVMFKCYNSLLTEQADLAGSFAVTFAISEDFEERPLYTKLFSIDRNDNIVERDFIIDATSVDGHYFFVEKDGYDLLAGQFFESLRSALNRSIRIDEKGIIFETYVYSSLLNEDKNARKRKLPKHLRPLSKSDEDNAMKKFGYVIDYVGCQTIQ